MAVVEEFFDIIYDLHVNMEGKNGKHAGQKRTYRTVSVKYFKKSARNADVVNNSVQINIVRQLSEMFGSYR